jgi:MoxR-vWA-beta-propeller ternary system domain bpX4
VESGNYFLSMIRRLREHEDVLLYGNTLTISEEDQVSVIGYLKEEYDREALDHPPIVPDFDGTAALWAALHVYLSAQLLLYRDSKPSNLPGLLPPFLPDSGLTPGAILSADLSLRFIPYLITQLKLIDAEDELIQLLESTMRQWHYSAIGHDMEIEGLDFSVVTSNACLHALYCDRIVANRKPTLANHPAFEEYVRASMGIFGSQLWKEFTPTVHE